MPNGFFQPKPNRFLLASQLFRQAPTTHWTGALAQALGGLTAGIGQQRQQADIARQQQAFQQAITGMLPQAQQPTAIPAQPIAQDLTPMGQALSGLAETGREERALGTIPQPQMAEISPPLAQPIPAGMPTTPAQPTGIQPTPQPTAQIAQPVTQPQPAGVSPQVISQLIAGGQPQLAFQLTQQARQQALGQQAAQQQAAQEQARIQQQQAFQTQMQKQQQEFQLQKLQQTEALREQAEKSRRAFEIRLKEGLIAPPTKEVTVSEASAKGVPAQAPDITSGFTPETAQKVKLESFKQGQNFLKNKDRLDTIKSQEDIVLQMNRAEALLNSEKLETGRVVGAGVAGVVPATYVSKEAQEFQSIVDKMTPLMRAGLPGSASDRDVAMFRGATIGLDKSESVNRNIIQAAKTQAQNFLDKAKFEENYFAVHKNLVGSDAAWNSYLEANPIFIPGSPTFELNMNRIPAKIWFKKINKGLTPQEILQGILGQ